MYGRASWKRSLKVSVSGHSEHSFRSGSWSNIASFTIEGPKVIVFNRTVDIYVTDESVMERAVSAVAEWESAIPKRTEIIWYVAD
jgi:hypothetical protein